MEHDQRTAKWLEHLRVWHKSGATQAAYCKKNSLHEKTFSNWKRRLRDHFPCLPKLTNSTVVSPNPVAPFIAVNITDDIIPQPAKRLEHEVQVVDCAGKASGISLSIGGKYHICVSTDFDSAALSRVLAVLADAS